MPSSFVTMGAANILLVVLLLLPFMNAGGASQTDLASQKTWCVAKPSSDEATLIKDISYACPETSCKDIHIGGPCFLPDTLQNHASVAMNLYYQAKGRNTWNCHFSGSGLIVATDPSYAKCIYR